MHSSLTMNKPCSAVQTDAPPGQGWKPPQVLLAVTANLPVPIPLSPSYWPCSPSRVCGINMDPGGTVWGDAPQEQVGPRINDAQAHFRLGCKGPPVNSRICVCVRLQSSLQWPCAGLCPHLPVCFSPGWNQPAGLGRSRVETKCLVPVSCPRWWLLTQTGPLA